MKGTRLKDIAEAAGVSVDTVSRILTGKTKGYRASSAEKIERVEALAQKMNYMPNKAAQVMRTKRTYQIGVISSELYNPYTGRTLEIMGEEFEKKGYVLLLGLLKGPHEEVTTGLQKFSNNLLDGLLNHHPLLSGEDMEKHVQRIPSVTFNRSRKYSPAIVDLQGGVMMAMEHLWALGHRKIAIMTGDENEEDRMGRLEGYESFYSLRSVQKPKSGIIHCGWTYKEGESHTGQFIDSGCTACLAGNDLLAVGLCTELRIRGYDVPGIYSIVSMDDTMLATISRPQLTSLCPPVRDLVCLTIEALLAKIEKRKPQAFKSLMPELVVRESTGPMLSE